MIPNLKLKCEIVSKSLKIIFSEPQGLDKEAFEFLQKYERPLSFTWVWETKGGIDELEKFTTNGLSSSVYAQYGMNFLGNYYYSKGDFAKAAVAFSKTKESSNKYISQRAKNGLKAIEARQCELRENSNY